MEKRRNLPGGHQLFLRPRVQDHGYLQQSTVVARWGYIPAWLGAVAVR
jgi:hypothetical protein